MQAWFAGMLGCSFSTSFKHLLFWRFVTGLGSALQMAGAQLFLADISGPSNRARVLGTNQVGVRDHLHFPVLVMVSRRYKSDSECPVYVMSAARLQEKLTMGTALTVCDDKAFCQSVGPFDNDRYVWHWLGSGRGSNRPL